MAFDGYVQRALAHMAEYELRRDDPVVEKRTLTGYLMLAPASFEVDDDAVVDQEGEWISGQSLDLERWA